MLLLLLHATVRFAAAATHAHTPHMHMHMHMQLTHKRSSLFYFLQFTRNAFESESVAGTHTCGLLVLTACCTCQHKAAAGGHDPCHSPPPPSTLSPHSPINGQKSACN